MKINLKPLDIPILLVSICISVFSILKLKNIHNDYVQVNANGTIYEYSLNKNGVYTFHGELGTTTMEILNGKVRFLDSSCPNKTCVAQGFSNTIVCLPNKVIATVNSTGDLDAIAE